jgi:hypothetical protein
MNSLLLIKQFPSADIENGKMVLDTNLGLRRKDTVAIEHKRKLSWKPPRDGETGLNVDGAFSKDGAGIGMAIRDHHGHVIFTACRSLTQCRDATVAVTSNRGRAASGPLDKPEHHTGNRLR